MIMSADQVLARQTDCHGYPAPSHHSPDDDLLTHNDSNAD